MPDPINIDLELSALEAMAPKQLRRRYREVWGEETRSGNKRFMIKRIAWKLQALAEGDLPERARQKALAIARDSDLRTTSPRPRYGGTAGPERTIDRPVTLKPSRTPTPGTQLTRVYKGKTVAVTVLENGFAYNGERYRTLSAAAKAITGTHVSGNAFFKLTGPKAHKEANA
jgi:Protein of unknown function (DUF2924)